ncbi:hypothetical protein BKA57DRAFT_461900 [Linnemannia elongata]|nr:hypothetical protein BKA57DRAFT_461900 [Linnemannia elongata]
MPRLLYILDYTPQALPFCTFSLFLSLVMIILCPWFVPGKHTSFIQPLLYSFFCPGPFIIYRIYSLPIPAFQSHSYLCVYQTRTRRGAYFF